MTMEMSNKRMKVLLIAPGGAPIPATKGGAVETLIDYVVKENENQNRMDLEILSMYDNSAFEKSKLYKNSKFLYIHFPKLIVLADLIVFSIAKYIFRKEKVFSYRYIFERFWTVHIAKRVLLHNDYDKVILENHIILLFIFKNKTLKKKYDGKYYYHVHNVMTHDLNTADVLTKSKKIITVSDFISKDIKKRYPNYDEADIKKLSNVSDLSIFGKRDPVREEEYRRKLNISTNDHVIMFAGRLDKSKGILETIKAFRLLQEDNIKLVIVGSYAFKSHTSNGFDKVLKKLVENDRRVVFTGYIEFDDMPYVYNISDIMVLPSICEDAAPLCIIESLCSGCTLITTNMGGIPEYVGDAGIVLENNERLVNSLYESITYLLNNSDKCNELSKRAYERTRGWTIKKYYNDYLDILEV